MFRNLCKLNKVRCPSPPNIDKIFEAGDPDQSGEIDWDEWVLETKDQGGIHLEKHKPFR